MITLHYALWSFFNVILIIYLLIASEIPFVMTTIYTHINSIVAMTAANCQIDTRVAPVVGRVGPRKKKKKKKPAPQSDVAMVAGSLSANRKSGSVYDIWGTGNNTEVVKE